MVLKDFVVLLVFIFPSVQLITYSRNDIFTDSSPYVIHSWWSIPRVAKHVEMSDHPKHTL